MDMIDWGDRKVPASYLGDGVYAIFDGCGIWLHANDHKHPTDRIYLEPEVFAALNRFWNDLEGGEDGNSSSNKRGQEPSQD